MEQLKCNFNNNLVDAYVLIPLVENALRYLNGDSKNVTMLNYKDSDFDQLSKLDLDINASLVKLIKKEVINNKDILNLNKIKGLGDEDIVNDIVNNKNKYTLEYIFNMSNKDNYLLRHYIDSNKVTITVSYTFIDLLIQYSDIGSKLLLDYIFYILLKSTNIVNINRLDIFIKNVMS